MPNKIMLLLDSSSTNLTTLSILVLYFTSILSRYSGLSNMAAKLNAEFFRPERWHSITVDVKIGTISKNKNLMELCHKRAK